MIEILLTVIPSVCWMVFRCYQLLHTPAERLARQLNVEIPHMPSVCVDQLGPTQLVLHWDIEIQPDENIFYVVLVNGKDAGTLAQTSVKLCNLEPDSLYRIEILAVNAISTFRSQSPAVYVRTQAKRAAKCEGKPNLPFSITKEVELPSSFHESPSTNYSLDLSAGEVANVTDKAVLAEYLYVFQNELSRIIRDIDKLSDHQRQEETRLRNELENYKKELEEGSDVRARKDMDVKDLEKKRDLLTFEKLKLSKQLKNYESHRNLHMNNLTELRARVSKLREKRQHVVNTSELEKSKVDSRMNTVNGEISKIKEEISLLELSVKELRNERKEISQMVQSLRPLVEQFVTPPVIPSVTDSPNASSNSLVASGEIFTRESSLTRLGTEVLRKIYNYKPDWEIDINKEIEALNGVETSWKNTFRAAIRRFVTIQNSRELARANQDKSYEPKKLTEYQASVEFGGFGNAIAKNNIKKKGYVFVDEGSASPSPPPEVNEAWYGNYSQIYDDSAEVLSPPSASVLNIAVAAELARYQPLHQNYTDSSGAIYGGSDSIAEAMNNVYAQGNFLEKSLLGNTYVGQQYADSTYGHALAGHNMYRENVFTENGFGEQVYADQPYTDQPYTDQQYAEQSYVDNAYMEKTYLENTYLENTYHDNISMNSHGLAYGDTNAYSMLAQPLAQPLANSTSVNYLQSEMDQGMPLHVQPSIPQSSMQQYAQDIRQSFPYEDVYSLRSPTPESYIQPVQNTLWNNQSQSNFLDSRRTFLGLSLLPSSVNLELHPLQSHNTMPGPQVSLTQPQMISQVPVPQDSGLFNSILLSSSTSQIPSSRIWLDHPMTTSYSHNRAVSNTSQLWRNDLARGEGSPSLGIMSDFLPFSPMKDKNDERNNMSPS